jgi:hypothetical protein
MGIGSLPKS